MLLGSHRSGTTAAQLGLTQMFDRQSNVAV